MVLPCILVSYKTHLCLFIYLAPDTPQNVQASSQGNTIYLVWENPEGRTDKFHIEWFVNGAPDGTDDVDYNQTATSYQLARPNSNPGALHKVKITCVAGVPPKISTAVETTAIVGRFVIIIVISSIGLAVCPPVCLSICLSIYFSYTTS